MKRREALKSITLSSGAVLTSGSILSLLQSCTADENTWKPLYFSVEEGKTLAALCDVIMPKDEWPSASEVNVPQFIDLMYKDVYRPEDGDKIKKGLGLFDKAFDDNYGDSFSDAETKDQINGLKDYFKVSDDERWKLRKLVENKTDDKSSDKYFIYSALTKVRELTITAYFQSEKIGEEFMPYLPVPTEWIGCMDVKEVGKVWSPNL